jgi:uncharacterized protein involved in type VI secretion and phage assembly
MMPADHASRDRVHDRYYGLFPATVNALDGDPENRQRVQVSLDWLPLSDGSGSALAWATMITPYADADQGFQLLPEIGSTVVVGFEAGYPDRPYIVGAIWNGLAAMPQTPSDANNLRVLQTRSGTRLGSTTPTARSRCGCRWRNRRAQAPAGTGRRRPDHHHRVGQRRHDHPHRRGRGHRRRSVNRRRQGGDGHR